MPNPIRTLPILENWDCHSCGHCCRGTMVLLDDSDLQRLKEQKWHERDEFRRKQIVTRESLLGGKKVLAKNPDGSCVFLTRDQRCLIHEEFGESAKPSVCRIFPFRLVPLEKQTNLTLRFACPSVVAGKGKPLQEKLKSLRQSGLASRFAAQGKAAPHISRRGKRDWRDFLHVADILRQFTVDDRLPLVRRLVHGLRFCSLLEECDLSMEDSGQFRELVEILKVNAPDDAGELFRERVAPSRGTGLLFRQTAVHFIRSYPSFPVANSLFARFRLLLTSIRFAWGGKQIPSLHPLFKAGTFAELENPFGPLSPELLAPINRYFESNATSLQYAVGPQNSYSLVESYRTLVFGFPMLLWMMRMAIGSEKPTEGVVIDLVATLDRAQGGGAITKSANLLGNSGRLEELVAWYAR